MTNFDLSTIENDTNKVIDAFPAPVRKKIYSISGVAAVVVGVLAAVLAPLGDFTVHGFHIISLLPYVLAASGLLHFVAAKKASDPVQAPAAPAEPSAPSAPATPAQ